MSVRALNYVKPLTHMPKNGTKLRASQKLLLMILADYYNDQERAAWVGTARLAKESLVSKRTAVYILDALVDGGILAEKSRRASNGATLSKYYRFVELDTVDEDGWFAGGAEIAPAVNHGWEDAKPAPPTATATAPKPLSNRTEPMKRYSKRRKNGSDFDDPEVVAKYLPGGKYGPPLE